MAEEHEEKEAELSEDDSFYAAENREDLVEGDGLSAQEEAFMTGYDSANEDKEDVKEVEETEEEL